ncbi:MAG TPA: relaxase/mobilization nuclease domain-containing protein, partial [Hyphomicrobiaceae bacterium]|nr:relaxase/mobilization nuclease domain-containing protein [Hyphomicrobiaceae bacterium]
MLANIEPAHNDFLALAGYLVHGRDRPTHPARAAWTFGHNLPTDDPLLAATLMGATAELSRRCRSACYHMSINWHPDEHPTPETMQEIARRTLDLAGLAEHQALVMGHGDKAHKHLHMMINRVHPDTGRAWSTSHDYRRLDRIMKLLSEEYGFRYVPPHSFAPELTDELPKPMVRVKGT